MQALPTRGEATRRVLRSLIKTDKETVEERALVPKNLKMMTREETQLMEMAHRLGYALIPVIKLRRELAQAIASRMINRTGENVYQSAAFSITNFPLSVLQELLPALLLTKDSNGTKTWSYVYPLVAPLALSFERALNLALACALGSGDTCTPTPPAAPSATATPCASGAAATGAAAHRDFLPGRIISSDLETCTDMCSALGARSPSTVDMKSPSRWYAWVQRVAAWARRVAAWVHRVAALTSPSGRCAWVARGGGTDDLGAGSRAPPQPHSGTHAARALLLGP